MSVLNDLLDAHEDYRLALLEFYRRLDISPFYAGEPRGLFAGLLVAQTVGGLALPAPREESFYLDPMVLSASGDRIRVLCISDRDGVITGGSHVRANNTFEELAIVAFVHAKPVAVHLIPSDRIETVGKCLGDPVFPGGGLCVTMGTHVNLMLEPVIAAAHGVRTYDLLPKSV